MDVFEQVYTWFMTLGDQYGVNPIIFGVIYIGAIPFFTLSIAWLVRNYRKGLSIVLPVLSASFFFVSAYLYLMIAGENVPWWVYGIVVAMLLYGAWTTYGKVRKKIETEAELKNG
ncbi:hypothetical protein BH23BAC3_BH23BAC3_20500 [soil metagenome]